MEGRRGMILWSADMLTPANRGTRSLRSASVRAASIIVVTFPQSTLCGGVDDVGAGSIGTAWRRMKQGSPRTPSPRRCTMAVHRHSRRHSLSFPRRSSPRSNARHPTSGRAPRQKRVRNAAIRFHSRSSSPRLGKCLVPLLTNCDSLQMSIRGSCIIWGSARTSAMTRRMW